MTVYSIIKRNCIAIVNDTSTNDYPFVPGKRRRYHWVCAKLRLKPCSETSCPIVQQIAALKQSERRKTVAAKPAVQHSQLAIALVNKWAQLQPRAATLWQEHQLVNDILDAWRSATDKRG